MKNVIFYSKCPKDKTSDILLKKIQTMPFARDFVYCQVDKDEKYLRNKDLFYIMEVDKVPVMFVNDQKMYADDAIAWLDGVILGNKRRRPMMQQQQQQQQPQHNFGIDALLPIRNKIGPANLEEELKRMTEERAMIDSNNPERMKQQMNARLNGLRNQQMAADENEDIQAFVNGGDNDNDDIDYQQLQRQYQDEKRSMDY